MRFILTFTSIQFNTLQLTVKDGPHGSVKSALAPEVTYQGSYEGVEYGASVDVSSDLLPKSIWGQTTTNISGWNLKTRAEYTEGKYDHSTTDKKGVYVTAEVTNEEEDAFFWGSGTVSAEDVSPLKLGAKKVFDTEDAKFMISPRYGFESNSAEVVLGIEKDETKVYVTASLEDQDVKIMHKIDEDNTASIKAGRSGFISASLENKGEFGSTTVTVTSDDVDIEVQKDGWVAGISASKPFTDAQPAVRFSKKIAFGP